MFVSVSVGGYAQNSPDTLLEVSQDETGSQMQKSVEGKCVCSSFFKSQILTYTSSNFIDFKNYCEIILGIL